MRTIMSTWTNRLKEAFRDTGWSKAELARRSGIQYDSLNKYLSGKVARPRGDSLPRLAQCLSVNVLWLQDGTEPKKGGQGLTQLGGSTSIPATPMEAVLETVANPHPDKGYLIRFTCPEFTSLCPVTGQPDFAHLTIDYVPDRAIIESKSLKLFLVSYRNHGGFHEACTVEIATRLVDAAKPKWLRIGGYWYPRGGIPIDIFYQTGQAPKGLWIPDQGVPPYRGRG
jgi:7-cyano-7-deazaguanine reductase